MLSQHFLTMRIHPREAKKLWRRHLRNLTCIRIIAIAIFLVHILIVKLDLIVFSTPFDSTAVDFLAGLDAPAYKIASFELVDLPLIRKCAAVGKPMIMSTGMADLAEISVAVQTAREAGATDIALLHCTSGYPAPPEESDLRTIPHLAEAFGLPTGLSDHTPGIAAAVASIALGATIIEKHFTYDQAADGPDHAASFDPAHFGEYIQQIRDAEREVGPIEKRVLDCEREVRTVSRQSVSVTRDLPAGHCIDRTDLTIKRPGTGIPAARLNDVVGRTLTRQVKANSLLHQDDLIEVLTHARAVG